MLGSNNDIMLGIEGIRITPVNWDTVHLPNLTSTKRLMVAHSSIGGMQLGNAAREVLFHMVSEQH